MNILQTLLTFFLGSKAQVVNTVGTGGLATFLLTKLFNNPLESLCFSMTEAAFFLVLVYVVLQMGLIRVKQEKK